MRDGYDGYKWLPAVRLSELLQEVPADSRVTVNTVGNLLVLSPDGTRSVAYIDFARNGSIRHHNDWVKQ